jgi:cholesterol transport system auxiliary component
MRGAAVSSVVLAVLLSGCALAKLGADPPAPKTYDLVAPLASGFVAGKRTGVQLVVAEPTAVRAVAGDDILVKPSPASVTYLADAQWSDTLPRLLQARLIETLEGAAAFRAVGDGRERLEGDVELLTQIRAFEISTDDAGTMREARVDLFAKLVDAKSGRALSSGTFADRQPVSGTNAAAGVDALNRAAQTVLPQIAEWAARVTGKR